MPHFIGEPRFFQDCEPGDLIRLAHRDGTRFAFTLCGNAEGVTDRAAILDVADRFPFAFLDGGEPVVCYGRAYAIREGFGPDALSAAELHVAGAISWRASGGEISATLMGSMDGRAVSVDLTMGRLSGARGGVGFNVTRWCLFLLLADGLDPVKVFEATGRALSGQSRVRAGRAAQEALTLRQDSL